MITYKKKIWRDARWIVAAEVIGSNGIHIKKFWHDTRLFQYNQEKKIESFYKLAHKWCDEVIIKAKKYEVEE